MGDVDHNDNRSPFYEICHNTIYSPRGWSSKEKLKETEHLGDVWYMHLKIENCCLKIYVEICVGEKMYGDTCNII